jgi:hypothetical protein
MSKEVNHLKTQMENAAAIDKVQRLMPDITKQLTLMAQMHRIGYDAHIKEGFTPEQALVLCQKMTMS